MSFVFPREISNDYEKLLEVEEDQDVIIYAGENENLKEFRAHSLILCTRSQYFFAAFYNDWVEKKNGNFILKKPNISPQLFKIILRFIYCGKIDLTNFQGPEMLKLLTAVDELNIQALINCVQKYLINDDEEFLQQNFTEILQIVYHNELFAELLSYCLHKIEILFNTDKILSLEAHLLEFLLKQDDLNLDEIEVWEGLVRWGLAQARELDLFKEILYKYIPLIRFYAISLEDYNNKVKSYEQILPKELREEISKFHLEPEPSLNFLPRRFVDSTIISRKHVAIFANRIAKRDRGKYKNCKVSYKFNLLFRASKDGNTAESFHAKCDNKGATLVVVKLNDSERLVGGYNPLFWDSSNSGKNTKDSFIFTFENKKNFRTAEFVYSYNGQFSIYCGSFNGPVFGYNDLSVNYNQPDTWYSYSGSYPRLDLPHIMIANDYEVFQVIRKCV
ncbi:unnamed protein product [Rhizophagus irregularis]|nr:unnamed protein product [Rhizophagus irregularis]